MENKERARLAKLFAKDISRHKKKEFKMALGSCGLDMTTGLATAKIKIPYDAYLLLYEIVNC